MTFHGHVKNGRIVLEELLPLLDGTEIELTITRTSYEGETPHIWMELRVLEWPAQP